MLFLTYVFHTLQSISEYSPWIIKAQVRFHTAINTLGMISVPGSWLKLGSSSETNTVFLLVWELITVVQMLH